MNPTQQVATITTVGWTPITGSRCDVMKVGDVIVDIQLPLSETGDIIANTVTAGPSPVTGGCTDRCRSEDQWSQTRYYDEYL